MPIDHGKFRGFAERVKRAGPAIAVNDTDTPQDEEPELPRFLG